jgi:transcription-repair coupling factor (superfamily II helicase)
VENMWIMVGVAPDRRTPLRDGALLENLHSLLTSVLAEPAKAAS